MISIQNKVSGDQRHPQNPNPGPLFIYLDFVYIKGFRSCFSGFPGDDKGKTGFLDEIARLKEFLDHPWLIKDDDKTVQVLVPKVVVAPLPPQLSLTPNLALLDGHAAEEISAPNKRTAMQRKAAAASLVAEDYARRSESGDTVDITDDCDGEGQVLSNVKVMCRLCFSGENERSERAMKMLSCKSCSKKYHRSCLKAWTHDRDRDLFHWSSWTCPSCRICETLLTHTHEANGVCLDCRILFRAMESVMLYASNSNNAIDVDVHTINSIENLDSKETLRHTIYKMSRAVPCECHNTAVDMHTRTLILLEMLGNYIWDAKVVLILAAFAITYGEFRLVLEVHAHNSLAASLAALKNLCWRDYEALRPQFKAMEMLIKEMVELAKCVVRFEGLLPQHLLVDDDHDPTVMGATKSQIYLATYWIFRSSLTSASQITDLIAMKQEQVNSNTTANAAWGLSSLALRLNRLCGSLRMQVDEAQDQIEQKLYKKLMDLVKDHTQVDNQQVLHLFFSLNDDLPFKYSSSSTKAKIKPRWKRWRLT